MRRLAPSVFALLSVLSLSAAPKTPTPVAPAPRPDAAPANAIASRHPEEGRPLIRAYRPADVGAANQVWALLQDKRGVILAGGSQGVAEYDGSAWRRVLIGTNTTSVRSLDMDRSGRVYVGATKQIGYLAPNASANLEFVSLNDKVPADARAFTEVFRTFALDDGVYFQTEQGIYKWANERFTVIKPPSRFNRAALLEGKIYVPLPETGLNVLEGTRLRALPGTEVLGNELFPIVLRYDPRRLLIGTRSSGLFLYDGATLSPFATQADDILKTNLYRGITLDDGTFVLTTTASGMVIIDRNGRRLVHVHHGNGLPSDVVYNVYPDREGALWLALDVGIARVETPSPVSFLDEREDLPGTPLDMIRHDGTLYAAGQTGVLRLAPARGTTGPRFEVRHEVSGSVLELRDVARDWRIATRPARRRLLRWRVRNRW